MTMETRLFNFKKALHDKDLADEVIVRRYITHDSKPFYFEADEDRYFSLKNIIADHFKVYPDHVKLVGSAKLGFSLKPKRLWKAMADDSDIDVVIISEQLFNEFWYDIYDFNIGLTVRTRLADSQYFEFLDYFLRGWIRPDLFPFNNPCKDRWFDFFKSISYGDFGPRKVTGAIFRNMHFFENYHLSNIRRLRAGGISA